MYPMAPGSFGRAVPNCTVGETMVSRRLADDKNDVADEGKSTVPSPVALETGVASDVNNTKVTLKVRKGKKTILF